MGSGHVRRPVRPTQAAIGVSFLVVMLGITVSPSEAACMPGGPCIAVQPYQAQRMPAFSGYYGWLASIAFMAGQVAAQAMINAANTAAANQHVAVKPQALPRNNAHEDHKSHSTVVTRQAAVAPPPPPPPAVRKPDVWASISIPPPPNPDPTAWTEPQIPSNLPDSSLRLTPFNWTEPLIPSAGSQIPQGPQSNDGCAAVAGPPSRSKPDCRTAAIPPPKIPTYHTSDLSPENLPSGPPLRSGVGATGWPWHDCGFRIPDKPFSRDPTDYVGCGAESENANLVADWAMDKVLDDMLAKYITDPSIKVLGYRHLSSFSRKARAFVKEGPFEYFGLELLSRPILVADIMLSTEVSLDNNDAYFRSPLFRSRPVSLTIVHSTPTTPTTIGPRPPSERSPWDRPVSDWRNPNWSAY